MIAEARFDELARGVAARTTRYVVLRRGDTLNMYVGCGYPKSGTVWLCDLLSTALGLPYPKDYRSPIAMAAVVHAHWRYDPRISRGAYIRRDGRDVMVSLYFYYVQALQLAGEKPARAQKLRAMFNHLYGPGFDPHAVRSNLPRFIEAQAAAPRGSDSLAWHQHVLDWSERPGIAQVAYEELLTDPVRAIQDIMRDLDVDPDEDVARLAAERWSFTRTSGRRPGQEDRASFQRKGIAGDWANHFTREAGEIFDAIAGDALVQLNYAENRDWPRKLAPE